MACVVMVWQFSTFAAEAQSIGQFIIKTTSDSDPTVAFDYWVGQGTSASSQVLLLVPGYNGSGARMLTPQWESFAAKNHLVLLAPTFRTSPEELQIRHGYYYPDQWSGVTTEKALLELGRREKVSADKILIFGFSAGAHFAHRFALWKPSRVKAFVAYSAAWWDSPTEQLAHVPALIMCGEDDPRYEATLQFMVKGQLLGLPWVWRSYRGTGHEMIPSVQKMAEVFLGHYAAGEPDVPFYGDVQTYQYVTPDRMESIPEQVRVRLPSKTIAEQWRQEK